MNKDKIIEILKSLPREFYEDAYEISIWKSEENIQFKMEYNPNVVKKLMGGNKWQYGYDTVNGYIEFTNDNGILITMT